MYKNDSISRQAAIGALKGLPTWWADEGGHYSVPQPPMVALLDPEDAISAIENLQPSDPTLYGYKIEHLSVIAEVLQKEGLPPDRVVEALTDIGRIISIVIDEFEESLRQAAIDGLCNSDCSKEGRWCDDGDCSEVRRLKGLLSHPDLSGYSDKLWRSAYERGKADAKVERRIDGKNRKDRTTLS